jgi:hypothetical protein
MISHMNLKAVFWDWLRTVAIYLRMSAATYIQSSVGVQFGC